MHIANVGIDRWLLCSGLTLESMGPFQSIIYGRWMSAAEKPGKAAIRPPALRCLGGQRQVPAPIALENQPMEKSGPIEATSPSFTSWCKPVTSVRCRPYRVWSSSWRARRRRGAKARTIVRRAAANRLAGHEPPTSAETVRAVIRSIRRSTQDDGQCRNAVQNAPGRRPS
jgi:hypothetical protein